jgi:hypothetical protein
MPNYVLNKMMEFEGPLTWERYLEFAYFGQPSRLKSLRSSSVRLRNCVARPIKSHDVANQAIRNGGGAAKFKITRGAGQPSKRVGD